MGGTHLAFYLVSGHERFYLIKSGGGRGRAAQRPVWEPLHHLSCREELPGGGVTFTAGPGATSSRTCAQMLMTFSRWEKSCSTMGTRVRSPRAGHTSSCLVAAALASSSEVHELLRDLGALAVIRAHASPPSSRAGGKPAYMGSADTPRVRHASGSTEPGISPCARSP